MARSFIKLPEKIFNYPDGSAVFAGSVPSGASSGDKPLVVFVPGLGSHAKSFWEKNTMYENAYKSGYRTAFIEFNLPGKKSLNMWNNGETLSRMLADICRHFRVPKAVLCAHSKGGVDSQTAAVYYGAAKYIDRIVTLSTPHFGSQLADIAYSSAGWAFAEMIDAHSPGCFSMQTGCMKEFRTMTDKNPDNVTPVVTFAGNGGADGLTRMWVGSLFLDRFGENDGVVTVDSAHNPTGEHLGTYHLNHAQMAGGKFIWSNLEPVLAGQPQEPAVAAFAPVHSAPPAHIIKGGRLEKGMNESFYVDSTAEQFTVSLLFFGGFLQHRFMLVSPQGRRTPLLTSMDPNRVIVLSASVKKPQIGKWRITAPPLKGAYCGLIYLKGKETFCACPKNAVHGHVETNMRILKTYCDGYDVLGEYSYKNGAELPQLPDFSDGVYNVEMHLSGELDDGSLFERSLIRPLTSGSDMKEILMHAQKPKKS